MEAFQYYPGTSPLLISIPHAGTQLTPVVQAGLSEAAKSLPDTDWHVPQLYEFARQTGAHLLIANYSRFVIDLNRPADDQPLYTTATTGLFPQTLFDGTPVFSAGKSPSDDERAACLTNIWQPYHQKIQDTLTSIKEKFGYALLFDAHSIASNIPRLFEGQLPDLNIGTNQEQSCAPNLQQTVEKVCRSQDKFSWVINGRFKGGYITRAYGQPEQHWHAIQLELAQCNYMEEKPPFKWREDRAEQLIPVLENIITQYTKSAESLAG
ncbi:N-formylglutamate amidohydrolase [Vibrio aerogenes CECT 7868]|uniref:N-formylglutamate amidohydrolase n=1 Tax=Vibrio aerogenes CECT 7868 TaxID=1216006 RepID=A0A1M5YFD6_9VIBR|nr:N-formylglutamate deformylase [Vibrio aerogenes]SHI10696.1 N-formylglutamate amidohydrolase [Vibrio aerogenes CECT 7868]